MKTTLQLLSPPGSQVRLGAVSPYCCQLAAVSQVCCLMQFRTPRKPSLAPTTPELYTLNLQFLAGGLSGDFCLSHSILSSQLQFTPVQYTALPLANLPPCLLWTLAFYVVHLYWAQMSAHRNTYSNSLPFLRTNYHLLLNSGSLLLSNSFPTHQTKPLPS